jgi:hypothetical protein
MNLFTFAPLQEETYHNRMTRVTVLSQRDSRIDILVVVGASGIFFAISLKRPSYTAVICHLTYEYT